MFTSRAEFRLSLRADNADQRLTPMGLELGCVGVARKDVFLSKMAALETAKALLTEQSFSPKEASSVGIRISQDGSRRTGFQLLAFPDVNFEDVIPLIPDLEAVDVESRRQVERDALYSNYLARQQKEIDVLERDEAHKIPLGFDFGALEGLSNELKVKLIAARPENLAQAARIDGMTPAALTLILGRLKRESSKKSA